VVTADQAHRLRRLSLWTPVVVYMAMIFFVSALPRAPLPDNVSDKTGHAVAYAVLGVLSVRAVAGGLPCRVTVWVALLALGITSGYGAFDELHQMSVPGRFGDVSDWYADTAGALAGVVACWAWGIIALRPHA
jgi:VanZ family protein